MKQASLRVALIPAVALQLGLVACDAPDRGGASISQPRGVDAFHSIDLRGAAELDVLVGPHQSVVVEAPEDTLARVTTTVVNGSLIIDSDRSSWWHPRRGGLKLRITLPKLNSLALNGVGHLTVSGLAGGATTIVLSGTGDVEANGQVDTLTARLNGAGNA